MLYSKTSQWTQIQERIKMRKITQNCIQRIKE